MEFRNIRNGGKKKTHSVAQRRSTSSLSKKSVDSKSISRSSSLKDSQLNDPTLPLSRRQHLLSKRGLIVSAGLLVFTSLTVGVLIRQDGLSQNSNTRNSAMSPTYPSVLPQDTSVDSLGGWQRISPPQSEPVFAYSDLIGDTPVSVSQQPLPDSFKIDSDAKVADVAKKFNATNKIDADTTKVYIGTSAKGPQSVIFTKKNLLILIKSQKKIDDTAWATYVQKLN